MLDNFVKIHLNALTSILSFSIVNGADVGPQMLGQISTPVLRNDAADSIPSLVVWEDMLEEALTGDLLHLLFAEVGGFTYDIDLKEANFEMELRSPSFRIYRALNISL